MHLVSEIMLFKNNLIFLFLKCVFRIVYGVSRSTVRVQKNVAVDRIKDQQLGDAGIQGENGMAGLLRTGEERKVRRLDRTVEVQVVFERRPKRLLPVAEVDERHGALRAELLFDVAHEDIRVAVPPRHVRMRRGGDGLPGACENLRRLPARLLLFRLPQAQRRRPALCRREREPPAERGRHMEPQRGLAHLGQGAEPLRLDEDHRLLRMGFRAVDPGLRRVEQRLRGRVAPERKRVAYEGV